MPTINLNALSATQGFSILGPNGSNPSVYAVSSAGDLNHDGLTDLAIGVIGQNRGWVVYGRTAGDLANLDLNALSLSRGFAINGPTTPKISNGGFSLASLGDINGDGIDDLGFGAPQSTGGLVTGRGYVIFGQSGNFAGDLTLDTLTAAQGVSFSTPGSNTLGMAMASAGDVNNDGRPDMMLSGTRDAASNNYTGAVTIIYGGSGGSFTGGAISPFMNNIARLNGAASFDDAGISVSGIGDVNGDGIDDMLVGAPGVDSSGSTDTGRAYVVYGTTGNFVAPIALNSLTPSQGFIVEYPRNIVVGLGFSVSGGGDVNGDGRADMLIAAAGTTSTVGQEQSVIVLFGQAANIAGPIDVNALTAAQGMRIEAGPGQISFDGSTVHGRITQVANAGDVNGDGLDDIVISQPKRISIVYGSATLPASLDLASLTDAQGFTVTAGGASGLGPVSAVGDQNGDGLDDILIGSGSSQVGSGAHVIYGFATPVFWIGTPGHDSHSGAGADDFLFGAAGNDTLYGLGGDDSLNGFTGDDQLFGGLGHDQLDGGANDDTLDGGAGADHLIGGSGDDTYVIDAQDTVTEAANGGNDTVVTAMTYALTPASNLENLTLIGTGHFNGMGNNAANILTGNTGNNNLSGGQGDDTLFGDAGNDNLNGGAGQDSLSGGLGQDVYTVDHPGDVVVELAGEGTDRVNASISYTLTAHVENLTMVVAGLTGTGNDLANKLKGSHAGADTLIGGLGDDSLDGGLGADSMVGGLDHDIYTVDDPGDVVVELAGEGTDRVNASVSYTLTAHVENLTMVVAGLTGTGNDLANKLKGSHAGADTLIGGLGDDSLDGGLGADSMVGGLGQDRYAVDDVGDVVVELAGEGTDLVTATVSYTLGAHVENLNLVSAGGLNGTGNALDNAIQGSNGADILSGGLGHDVLKGNQGNDRLIGGQGSDSLTGGAGNDVLVYHASSEGGDVITGFAAGADRIEVSAMGFGGGLVALQALTANQFVTNNTGLATQAGGQFIYQANLRKLFWDQDGTGGNAAELLASFNAGTPPLVAGDIWVV
jgi:Ca2+-binding RTX toxin-like protein